MKLLVIFFLVLCLSVPAFAGGYGVNSPTHPNNSQFNPQNSQYNPNNSRFNPSNSRFNPSATNGTYDNYGNRTGYSTPKAGGGHNYFNDDGDRVGYDND